MDMGNGCLVTSPVESSEEATSNTSEALIDVVTSVRKLIHKLELALTEEKEDQIWEILQSMKSEAETSIQESYKVSGRVCSRRQGVKSTASIATQTARRAEVDELRKGLIDGVGQEALPELTKANWPKDFYQNVRMLEKTPESSEGGVIIVHDIHGGPNKNLVRAPLTESRARTRKMALGQLLAEPKILEDLLAETREVNGGKILTLVLDSTDMEKSVHAASAVIRKINEMKSGTPTFLITEGKLGNAFVKVLEYELRRINGVADCYLVKAAEKKRSAQLVPPSQVMVVKAQGRTYADLL